MMKKILFVVPFSLALFACANNEANNVEEQETDKTEVVDETEKTESTYVATTTEWEIDERLQEPTEDTVCEMCNMKVYTRDHEMGVFSAQAVKEDGSVAFYDDIGCLLNAEVKFNETNEKFVRDYATLNWFPVEEATIVKTELKSPMNWGYIFFKFEEDANLYISQNKNAYIEKLETIQAAAKERMMKKMQESGEADITNHEGHMQGTEESDGHMHDMEKDSEGQGNG